MLGKFIARAVADDCLPPAFVKNYTEDTGEESLQRKALGRADVLLKMKHGMVRLDNVWGVGGGRRPVKQLIKKMVLLLKEYLSSEDVEEVGFLKSIDVQHIKILTINPILLHIGMAFLVMLFWYIIQNV